MARDPICGMMVDVKTPAATSEYKGKTYYFCSKACKVRFDKEPEKYASFGGLTNKGRFDND